MSSLQLAFTLRTSPGCKTVHLLGSWDGYRGQLPMSKDATSSKSGAWKGTFKFSSQTLVGGQRYWYYYIIDGYHASHDPANTAVTEPTTGRKLNILDVPGSKSSSSSKTSSSSQRQSTSSTNRHSTTSTRSSRPNSQNLANGRGVSPSKIKHPRPTRPYQKLAHDSKSVDALSRKLAGTRISSSSFSSSESDSDSSSEIESDASSDIPSLSSGSRSPASSMSSGSRSPASGNSSRTSSRGSKCSCRSYGLNRRGERVKVDCGGRKCGYSDKEESSSSGSEEEEYVRPGRDRRHGIVVRGSRR